jgi:hypothetical protein
VSIIKFAERLENLGCKVQIGDESIEVAIDDNKISIRFTEEWLKAIKEFYRARQYQFDEDRSLLYANNFVEFEVWKLDPEYIYKPMHKFSDAKGNEVKLSTASEIFMLSYFESSKYEKYFPAVRRRIKRRCDLRKNRSTSGGSLPLKTEDILFNIQTATYTPKRKIKRENIAKIGAERIKSSLFSLAYHKNESWEISEDLRSIAVHQPRLVKDDVDLEIPPANYDNNLVNYYKVAKSSTFPFQKFLSYYHVLEYFFLQVADENLFQEVKTNLNDPSFKATYKNVSKLVAIIQKSENTNDEKQMLKAVLNKYVQEDEYIEFIKSLDSGKDGKKIYSGTNVIFGDFFPFKLESGHALSNASAILKHIRNSLVHSSDRYTREECHKPFSESEEVVCKYIPLVQYLAEKIIFATAN